MKVDKIYKNANVWTSNVDALKATAFAVKDSKFVYVGDEAGLAGYEGETIDLGGKFVMPAVMDSHIHIPASISNEFAPAFFFIECHGKKECLDIVKSEIDKNPGKERYNFTMSETSLEGDKLNRHDLDNICATSEIFIIEGESHSGWGNSLLLKNFNITADTPDLSPGLSYYERDENGEPTGYMIEMTIAPIVMQAADNITDEQIDKSLKRFIEYAKRMGICAVFEAGTPGGPEFHERVYKKIKELDRLGEWPIYMDGCYSICDHAEFATCIDTMKNYRKQFSDGNVRVNTLKTMMDGTLSVHTAYMVTPYADTGTIGGNLLSSDEVALIIESLNEEGFDFHIHTVGEGASRMVLDGVEKARQKLGDDFKSQITCAHLEIQDAADIPRFAKLGVYANYSVWWHAGGGSGGGGRYEDNSILFGPERAKNMYRSRSAWDSGTNVCWSSDNIAYDEGMLQWSPYLGMEAGMTRLFDEKTNLQEVEKHYEQFPSASECMTHEQMLLGYTINNARQLRIEDRKGSIEVGKDADYLIFDEDLSTIDPRGMSYIEPKEVFFSGKKMK